ncbi:MAG TPA: AAA family ATPase, partial [Chloroflexia bacterium]
MEFLEREQYADTLGAVLREAVGGAGRTVLIGGEAGIGKTTLVERFIAEQGRAARVLWGACDALLTPRPLGPLHDIMRQAPAELGTLLDLGKDWLDIASALLAWLERGAVPTVIVVEDAHWADEATLDLLRFLGRRMPKTRALLVVTYRDDELAPQHSLWRVLGDLPARATIRLALPRLSEAAVDRLAQQAGRPTGGLYVATGGNPFFVTEVLAHGAEGLPATVRDAVLGRAARLSPPARQVLDLASIVPGAIEPGIVAAVCGPSAPQIEECAASGLLLLRDDRLAFRHDLARRAVEETLPATRARELHAQVLAALTGDGMEPVPLARLVHHATQAGHAPSVLRFAPLAARQASGAGAHCQAADHYATALRYAARLPPAERAELLEGRSFECYLMADSDAAIQARQEATDIWRRLDRPEREGDGVRWLSRLFWQAGNKQEADRYADEAIAILEPLAPGPALAMAYSNRAQLHGLAEEHAAALGWGRRALALAWELGETEIMVHALTNIGADELRLGDEAGRAKLETALATALAHELHDHVARAYANLACAAIEGRDYARGLDYLEKGLAYATARDLDTYGPYLRGWRARARFEQGQWRAAEEDARRALRDPPGAAVIPLPALITLGHLYARCGEPTAAALLDSARTIAIRTGEPQRLGPLAAARAEAA